jgi:hypothetical protein
LVIAGGGAALKVRLVDSIPAQTKTPAKNRQHNPAARPHHLEKTVDIAGSIDKLSQKTIPK